MQAFEKQFAKTFDVAKDEFVPIKGVTDLEKLEKIRYLDSQINLIQSKIENITRMIQSGDFKYSQDEIIKKLEELENKSKKLSSKTELYAIMLSDFAQNLKSAVDLAQESISVSDMEAIIKKFNAIEKKYSSLTTPRMQNIFINLIETVEVLSSRTKNLEISFTTVKDIKWNKKMKSVKEGITAPPKQSLTLEEKQKQTNKEGEWLKISNSIQQLRLSSKFEKKEKKVQSK